MSLTQRILLAMFLGLTLGAVLQWADLPQEHFLSLYFLDGLIDSGGKIFVTLLKMMVVPLVFVYDFCHPVVFSTKRWYSDLTKI